jgi:2'-5' RNA ligase
MRLFLAIELPDPIRQSILRLAKTLRRFDVPEKSLIRRENLHLTLKFIGEVTDPAVSPMCDVLRQIPTPASFRLQPSHLGCLPERGEVRIISVGLDGQLDLLQSLYEGIESASSSLGLRKEGRRFHPHITVARLRKTLPSSARQELERIPLPDSAGMEFDVREFVLMQSVFEPAGVRYLRVARFPLAAISK